MNGSVLYGVVHTGYVTRSRVDVVAYVLAHVVLVMWWCR